MIRTSDGDWLDQVEQALDSQGYAVLESFIADPLVLELREDLYAAQVWVKDMVGEDRLVRAGERGVIRLLPQFGRSFLRLLELPHMLDVVDRALGTTSILHLQNGFILPTAKEPEETVFQYRFHMDFPRVLNGYRASINVFIALDPFSSNNGGTRLLPRSQHRQHPPDAGEIATDAITAHCPAGAAIVFDSTLWHAAGQNVSGRDRLAINHQFTRSWIKQQIDYCRALGPKALDTLPERTQQLLGRYTQVVTSLDEYYQPEDRRVYRRGQG